MAAVVGRMAMPVGAAFFLICGLLFASSGHTAERRPAYDPAQWTGQASHPPRGSLGQWQDVAPRVLPGTLSGSVEYTPPAESFATTAPASKSVSRSEPMTGSAGKRPWGEVPPRFQSPGETGNGQRREPPVVVAPGGYLPGLWSSGLFPLGYTPDGYGTGWLTPGLGYGSGYPGVDGHYFGWPSVWGLPGVPGSSPFLRWTPFSWY